MCIQTAVSECRVVRVKSPYLFYYAFDAEDATHTAGTLVLNGYEPVALHRHHCPGMCVCLYACMYVCRYVCRYVGM